jgi:ankyrin repeat protein
LTFKDLRGDEDYFDFKYLQVKMSEPESMYESEAEKVWYSMDQGDVAAFQACLSRGVNVNDEYNGVTPLMNAVIYVELELFQILLARDELDIAAVKNDCGNTALHLACSLGSRDEFVALLVTDRRMTSKIINIKNYEGETALMTAVKRGDISCVRWMTEVDGVDWETENNDGESLEDVAVAGNR